MRDFHAPGRSTVHSTRGMAACSQPLASLSAIEILRRGGNAVDAAVAAAAVLCVVEPQSTAIGGDMFALVSKKGSGEVIGLNGSGRAPGKLTARYLLDLGHNHATEHCSANKNRHTGPYGEENSDPYHCAIHCETERLGSANRKGDALADHDDVGTNDEEANESTDSATHQGPHG